MTYYPPRPANAIAPTQLSIYEKEGWVLQTKMDGMCGVFVLDGSSYHGMNRQLEPIRRWSITEDHKAAIREFLPSDGQYVLVGEVIHGRVVADHIKHNPIFFHDVLVAGGKSLVGTTYADRQKLLEQLLPAREGETETHHIFNRYVWRARNYTKDFAKTYELLQRKRAWFPEYEGVVLKRPKARLMPTVKATANESWQLKSRFPTDTLTF